MNIFKLMSSNNELMFVPEDGRWKVTLTFYKSNEEWAEKDGKKALMQNGSRITVDTLSGIDTVHVQMMSRSLEYALDTLVQFAEAHQMWAWNERVAA